MVPEYSKSELYPSIKLDIDRERIREIVSEAYHIIEEYEGDCLKDYDSVLLNLNKILDNGLISIEFFINIGCSKIPDLKLRVDPRRKKVLGISNFKKKVADLNHLLRAL